MLLGYCYGKTLKDIFSEKHPDLLSIRELQQKPNRSTVYTVVRVKESKIRKSKKGNKYIWMDVYDETGDQVVMLFNGKKGELMDMCIEQNNGLPKENSICIIKGEKQEDTVFAELVAVQNNRIYTKLSQLKDSI